MQVINRKTFGKDAQSLMLSLLVEVAEPGSSHFHAGCDRFVFTFNAISQPLQKGERGQLELGESPSFDHHIYSFHDLCPNNLESEHIKTSKIVSEKLKLVWRL